MCARVRSLRRVRQQKSEVHSCQSAQQHQTTLDSVFMVGKSKAHFHHCSVSNWLNDIPLTEENMCTMHK